MTSSRMRSFLFRIPVQRAVLKFIVSVNILILIAYMTYKSNSTVLCFMYKINVSQLQLLQVNQVSEFEIPSFGV